LNNGIITTVDFYPAVLFKTLKIKINMAQIINLDKNPAPPKKDTVSSLHMLSKSFHTLCESAKRQGINAFVVMLPGGKTKIPDQIKNEMVEGLYKQTIQNPLFAEIVTAVSLKMSVDKLDALLEEKAKTIIPKSVKIQ
jgi:hypothetical protein